MLKEERQYRRIHSFSQSPNFSQIIAWLVFLIETAIFYSSVLSLLINETVQIIFACVFSLTLASLVFFAAWTGQIDPTDDVTIAYKTDRHNFNSFIKSCDIQNCDLMHCQKCNSKKLIYNPHCGQCQRCIQDQDHHCAFLNICVGSKNYRHFFVTVCLAFLNLSTYLISFGLGVSFFGQSSGYTLSSAASIISVVGAVIVLCAWLAITVLLIFHVYLIRAGITTRQFINKGIRIPKRPKKSLTISTSVEIKPSNQIIESQMIQQKKDNPITASKYESKSKLQSQDCLPENAENVNKSWKDQSRESFQSSLKSVNQSNSVNQIIFTGDINNFAEGKQKIVNDQTKKTNHNLINPLNKQTKTLLINVNKSYDQKQLQITQIQENLCNQHQSNGQNTQNQNSQIEESSNSPIEVQQTNKRSKKQRFRKFIIRNSFLSELLGVNPGKVQQEDDSIAQDIQIRDVDRLHRHGSVKFYNQKQEDHQNSFHQENSSKIQKTQPSMQKKVQLRNRNYQNNMEEFCFQEEDKRIQLSKRKLVTPSTSLHQFEHSLVELKDDVADDLGKRNTKN